MKKILSSILLTIGLTLIIPFNGFPEVNAETHKTMGASNSISTLTRALYISHVYQSLSISGTTATLKCDVIGIPGVTTKIKVTGILQRLESGVWKDYKSTGTQTQDGSRMTYLKTASVVKGYSYRAKFTVTAYAGTAFETFTVFSSAINI